MWKRFRRSRTVRAGQFLKQGNWEPVKGFLLVRNLVTGMCEGKTYCFSWFRRCLWCDPCVYERPSAPLEEDIGIQATIRSPGHLRHPHIQVSTWMVTVQSLKKVFWLGSVQLDETLKNLPKFFGEILRMNPKSMWNKCPSECSKILPLCLWKAETLQFRSFEKLFSYLPVLHL